jgi:hypothetical protein
VSRAFAVSAVLAVVVLTGVAGGCAPAPDPTAATGPSDPPSAGPAVTPLPSPTATAAAVATPTPAPPVEDPSALLEALTLLEPANHAIAFTDWVALKRSTGSDDVAGSSAFETKVAALGTEYAASGAWLSSARVHRTDWGFDAFDLAWEATGSGPAGVLHVLRFADPAVPLALLARLDALGFASEPLGRGTLRSGSLPDLPGQVVPSPALGNVAVLDNGVTAVASASGDLVRTVLTSGPVTPESDAAVAAAALLEDPTTAFLLGADACTAITEAVLATRREGDGPSAAEQLATAGTLGHPEVIAVAYGTGATVRGRVVMTYADPAAARSDLEPRGILARAGTGISRPLAEVQTVVDARLEGASIVLDLEPPAGEAATRSFARQLMSAVTARDMIYAACTP